MLAAMATHSKQLETAEVAYSAINEADKVHYIQYIKDLPSKDARNAEMAVLTGKCWKVASNRQCWVMSKIYVIGLSVNVKSKIRDFTIFVILGENWKTCQLQFEITEIMWFGQEWEFTTKN